jgi:predicted nucleic acid-binding protein
VAILGPIRQEVLSGVRRETEFERLRRALEPFDDLALVADDYVQAARFHNRCRSRGIAATSVDLLICAAAGRHSAAVFTTDGDFKRYARWLPIRLFG